MKRLLHILVLALALAGLMAPGLRAEGRTGQCARALWAQGQSVASQPAPVKVSGLAAPLRIIACPDLAVMATAASLPLAPRPVLPRAETTPLLRALVSEAEPPPPRGA